MENRNRNKTIFLEKDERYYETHESNMDGWFCCF